VPPARRLAEPEARLASPGERTAEAAGSAAPGRPGKSTGLEIAVDKTAPDQGQFRSQGGGLNRMNRLFGGRRPESMNTTRDIVQKLWDLCHVLRDDALTYPDCVTELTRLLFLKMAEEAGTEDRIPDGCRWQDLESRTGVELLDYYRDLLVYLGARGRGRVQQIFAGASTSLRHPRSLRRLVEGIDALDWRGVRKQGLGELYEGLLEKNAAEQKSEGDQYFTPRALIDTMVELVQPRPGERIQDPAAGTGGFLVAADRYMRERTDDYSDLSEREQEFQRRQAFSGMELAPGAHRLCVMNAVLHGIEGKILLGDTLSPAGASMPAADVILTNPAFGPKRGGGRPTREDFAYPTSNRQLAFLQHVYRGLLPGGRAAVVLPDNVLFEEGTGAKIRADLMHKCNLHTILRLPLGIFHAQGVKTNVLFFQRGDVDEDNTRAVWVYDLRANLPAAGKRVPLTRRHFSEVERVFGEDPFGWSKRQDQGENGRFRRFTREEIAARRDNLDISWLKDESGSHGDDLPEPETIAAEIIGNLRSAMDEMSALTEILGEP
jgi:type I restriction enzyme M protein